MKLPSLNTKVLSIDFGSSHIKVVEGQVSKKGLSILKSFSVNLLKESYEDGKVLDSYTIS